jgi:ubiquinone/menaquinone biosynthesis C-methylase UbiE
MQRIPEPELMDDHKQASAYAAADFSEPHDRFVDLFHRHFGGKLSTTVLDLGCGPGDICRRFAHAYPECRLHAVDASAPMLELGRRDSALQGLQDRIRFIQAYLPMAELPQQYYDVIVSNSLLHHLKQPATLWQSIKQFGRAGTTVFIMDLLRPETTEQAARLVDNYAANEADILRQDFFNSLCAAYRADEVTMQLQEQGLHELELEVVSDRHFVVFGCLTENKRLAG